MLSKDEVIRAGKFIVKWGGSSYTGADANNKQTPGWTNWKSAQSEYLM